MPEKLNTSILIRLSQAEKLEWQEKAARAGISLASLVREAMKKTSIQKYIERPLIQERTREIRRIGINLNQIARWANTYKETAEALEIIEILKEIEEAIKTLSRKEATSFPSAPKEGGKEDAP
jgi:hypothetical protein